MAGIDPTALAGIPSQLVIPFTFVPLWLIFVLGLVVSTLAIAVDGAGSIPYRRRPERPRMKGHVLRTGATVVLSRKDGQLLPSVRKG